MQSISQSTIKNRNIYKEMLHQYQNYQPLKQQIRWITTKEGGITVVPF